MSTIGKAIDRLHTLKEQKKAMEAVLAAKVTEISECEREIMGMLDDSELDRAGGTLASVSISKSTKPMVESWQDFYDYIRETGQFQLLDRRPSATGCREIFDAGNHIPGVVPGVFRKLNIRSK